MHHASRGTAQTGVSAVAAHLRDGVRSEALLPSCDLAARGEPFAAERRKRLQAHNLRNALRVRVRHGRERVDLILAGHVHAKRLDLPARAL